MQNGDILSDDDNHDHHHHHGHHEHHHDNNNYADQEDHNKDKHGCIKILGYFFCRIFVVAIIKS